MSTNDLVLIAGLVLIALCGNLVGFPFLPALGFAFILALISYLVQTGGLRRKDKDE
jgi:flagellar biosynthesis component FlhA